MRASGEGGLFEKFKQSFCSAFEPEELNKSPGVMHIFSKNVEQVADMFISIKVDDKFGVPKVISFSKGHCIESEPELLVFEKFYFLWMHSSMRCPESNLRTAKGVLCRFHATERAGSFISGLAFQSFQLHRMTV